SSRGPHELPAGRDRRDRDGTPALRARQQPRRVDPGGDSRRPDHPERHVGGARDRRPHCRPAPRPPPHARRPGRASPHDRARRPGSRLPSDASRESARRGQERVRGLLAPRRRPEPCAGRVPGRLPSLPTSAALRAAAATRAGALPRRRLPRPSSAAPRTGRGTTTTRAGGRHSPAWSSGIARTTHRRLERRRSTRPRGPRPNRLPHPRLSRRPLLRPRDVKGPSERSTERLRGLPSAGPDPPLERSLYNPGVARLRGGNQLLRVFFVIYALEAGAFLTFAPWGRYWMVRVVGRSPERTRPFLASPYFRSFLLGLGLLHLWAAASEIEAWRRKPRGVAPPAAPRETA